MKRAFIAALAVGWLILIGLGAVFVADEPEDATWYVGTTAVVGLLYTAMVGGSAAVVYALHGKKA